MYHQIAITYRHQNEKHIERGREEIESTSNEMISFDRCNDEISNTVNFEACCAEANESTVRRSPHPN
jgi:hypothetical protein